jgi:hypothetical protein
MNKAQQIYQKAIADGDNPFQAHEKAEKFQDYSGPDFEELEKTIKEDLEREQIYAGWMFQVLLSLPNQKGYNSLPEKIREEIERIIAAVE